MKMKQPGREVSFTIERGTEECNDIKTRIILAPMFWFLQGLFDSIFSHNSTWIQQYGYMCLPFGDISISAMELVI